MARRSTTSIEQLQRLEPLSTLSGPRLEELLPLTEVRQLALGQSLFTEGDADNQIVYLLEGEVQMHSADGKLELLMSHKMSESRFPLDDSQPHMLSCVALGNVCALFIDNSVLDYLMMWDQLAVSEAAMVAVELEPAQELAEADITDLALAGVCEPAVPADVKVQQMDNRDWVRRMRQVMAFKNLPPANIRSLLACMETMPVKAGEIVVRQGEKGDYYYVLTDGEACVTQSIELARLQGGDSFGEEALLCGGLRNATVTMLQDGQLMRLAKRDFDSLLKEPMLRRLSADEAGQLSRQGACWLDVRYAREYARQHLPGAINIPLHELRSRLDELQGDRNYICYCSTGRRSSAAAFLLAQKGFRASVLSGGMQGNMFEPASARRPAERPATEQV